MKAVAYTDSRGRRHRLTRAQWHYLLTARTHQFPKGWGGLDSTLVVRILEERGLIVLDTRAYEGWRVTALTPLGTQVLEAAEAAD